MSAIRIQTGKKKEEVQRTAEGGIEGGFTTDVMSTLSSMFSNEETDIYVYCADKYLRMGLYAFLKSLKFTEYLANEDDEYVYINMNLGYVNTKTSLPEGIQYKHQLPYDWTFLINEVNEYMSEHPIPEKEIVEKNSDNWNMPRDLQGIPQQSEDEELEEVAETESFESEFGDNPNDYLVHISADPNTNNGIWLALNPKAYYESDGCLYDQHCDSEVVCDILEKNGYSEAMEGMWEKTFDVLPTFNVLNSEMNTLKQLGFSVDIRFSNFMEQVNINSNHTSFDVFQ